MTVVPAFPYPRYRPGQREALEQARAAFADGRRFVVVEAPTGAGKSAIGVALAREAAGAYVLTAQKLLQDQYVRDFPDLSSMKGRANYPCLVADTHAAAAPCIAGRYFPQCEACPYFTAKDEAMAADGTIMNYAYYLAEMNYAGGFGSRELLVLDEAHGIETALMGFVELRISDGALAWAGVAARLPQVLDELELFDAVEDLEAPMRDRKHDLEALLSSESLPEETTLDLLRQKRWLDQRLAGLELLCTSREEEDVPWVVDRDRDQDGQRVVFRPVEVASLAEPLLFRFGRRVLLLSATILDATTYLRSLGIPPDEAEVIRVASSFPPERRPVVVRPSARLTRHHLTRELPQLVRAVQELIEEHEGEKGIVHAHSYRIARAIADGLPPEQQRRLVMHADAHGREDAFRRHVDSPEPTVLLTPSMTEGIDLPGELARWQIICKIPYPYLGDPQVAARKELDPAWYAWRTCLRVVQAYGRGVRSVDDYAVTYVLDADFPAMLRRERARFPDWFLEALAVDDGSGPTDRGPELARSRRRSSL